MEFFDRKLARKRALTRLRVQKYRALRKSNQAKQNKNPSVENCVNNSIVVPSSCVPSEANISNFENWGLFEIDDYQEQNIPIHQLMYKTIFICKTKQIFLMIMPL